MLHSWLEDRTHKAVYSLSSRRCVLLFLFLFGGKFLLYELLSLSFGHFLWLRLCFISCGLSGRFGSFNLGGRCILRSRLFLAFFNFLFRVFLCLLCRIRDTLIFLIVRSCGLLLTFNCFSCFSVAFHRFCLLLLRLFLFGLLLLLLSSVLGFRLIITLGFFLGILGRRLFAFSFFCGIVTLFGLCFFFDGGWLDLFGFFRLGFLLFLLLCNSCLSAALANWRSLFLFLLSIGFRRSGCCLFSSIRRLARFLRLLFVVFTHF